MTSTFILSLLQLSLFLRNVSSWNSRSASSINVRTNNMRINYMRKNMELSMTFLTQDPYTAVMIIPTGIGASIGGYAGDGLPSAR